MEKVRGLIQGWQVPTFVLGFVCLGAALPALGQLPPGRVFPLPEVEAPSRICAKLGKAFIVDKRDIVVYNLESGRFIKRIGKIGQGPGEFKMGPSGLQVLHGRLIVGDFRKIEYFTAEGVYQGQTDDPTGSFSYPFLPVGQNFVGFSMRREEKSSWGPPSGRVYDRNLKLLKAFFGDLPELPAPPPPPGSEEDGTKKDALLIREYGDFIVYNDKIYVADSRKGGSISVFDENGEPSGEIRFPVGKVKVPAGFVSDTVKEWKASPYWDRFYSRQNPVVPEFFPAFFSFKIDGGRIYVVTSARKDAAYEVLALDLQGRLLDRGFRFPLKPNFEVPLLNGRSYDIEGNRFVWYAYNDAKEMYELHVR